MSQYYQISLSHLSFIALPLLGILFIYIKWSLDVKTLLYATLRMVSQLILVGYALLFIFTKSHALLSSGILLLMVLIAAWIALRPIKENKKKYYIKSFLAILFGGLPVLLLAVLVVIQLKPWYEPRYLIPLAGMVFANAMNAVSLCAERLFSELKQGKVWTEARVTAFKTGLLPFLNTYFAVGLVSLPGMMTGQILAGMSPLMAVRYQIMIMAMMLSASGIACVIFLKMIERDRLCTKLDPVTL